MEFISRLSTQLADLIWGKEKPKERELTNAERVAAGLYERAWTLCVSIPHTVPGAGAIVRYMSRPPEGCFLLKDFEDFMYTRYRILGMHDNDYSYRGTNPREQGMHRYRFVVEEGAGDQMRSCVQEWFNQRSIKTIERWCWNAADKHTPSEEEMYQRGMVGIYIQSRLIRDD